MAGLEIALVCAIVLLASCLLADWVVYTLSIRRRRQSEQHARQFEQELEQAIQDYRQIERAARQYFPTDPAPYGPVARELDQQLTEIRDTCRAHNAQRLHLLGQGHVVATSPFHRLCARLSSELPYWRRQQEATGALADSVRTLPGQIDRAWQSLETLRALPLQASRRCRELDRQIASISTVVQQLYQAGVHGTTFDQAATQAAQLTDRFEQLPDWCTATEPDMILQQATKASTIRAWQILDDLEGAARDQRVTFQRWHTVHQESGESLRELKHALDQAWAHLEQVPDSIDVEDRALRLTQLETVHAEMEARHQAPTVEDLDDLQNRLSPVAVSASELVALFESIVRNVERLRDALEDNARLMRETETEMKDLAQAAEYRIDWESLRDTAVCLHQVRASIGALTDRRTPERLDEHVRLADDLTRQGQALKQTVMQARNTRRALLSTLERPELDAQPTWFSRARDLSGQARRFAPSNWPAGHDPSSILGEAQELEQRRERWIPASTDTVLPVTRLDTHLSKIGTLVGELASFQRYLDQVDRQLTRLEHTRQDARQNLQLALGAVERLLPLLRDATPRMRWSLLGPRPTRQLERALQSGNELLAGLQHQDTSIEAHVIEIDRWMSACLKALRGLHEAIHPSTLRLETSLQGVVTDLESLAPFDQETTMVEAHRQLDIDRPGTLPPSGGGSAASQIEALVDDAIHTLRDRERLYVALGNLESQIVNRIAERRAATDRERTQARAGHRALVERKEKSEHMWPPLRCDRRLADNHLASAEREEQALRSAGRTVQGVIGYLDRIAERYQSLNNEVQSRTEQNDWQRQEVQERWDKLVRWQKSLDDYRHAHEHEPETARAVRDRRDYTSREMQRVRRAYGRSPMAHEETRRILEELWGQVHDREMSVRGQSTSLQARDIEAEFPF
jgi:hypothetical protein